MRALVYVCALVPVPGRSFSEQVAAEPQMLLPGYRAGLAEPDGQGRRRWVNGRIAKQVLFADCDEDVAGRAVERLRPQADRPYLDPLPLDAFPDAPATYVVCAEDRIVNPSWSRRVAAERLSARLVELPGSHSPFLSRPAALATVLEEAG